MTHYIIHDGRFADSARRLLDTDFRLNWQARPTPPLPSRNKAAYVCPKCAAKVWGHAGHADRLLCIPCHKVFEPLLSKS